MAICNKACWKNQLYLDIGFIDTYFRDKLIVMTCDVIIDHVFFSSVRKFKMKIKNSIKSLRGRHRDCRVVRRRGRLYVINKTNPRFKARQG